MLYDDRWFMKTFGTGVFWKISGLMLLDMKSWIKCVRLKIFCSQSRRFLTFNAISDMYSIKDWWYMFTYASLWAIF